MSPSGMAVTPGNRRTARNVTSSLPTQNGGGRAVGQSRVRVPGQALGRVPSQASTPEAGQAEAEPDALTIGRRIRHLRTSKGMTLDDLASAIDRAPSQVSTLENGKREPKFSQLQTIARALGVGVDDLLSAEAPSERDGLEIE